jgi:hypothetical protein
MSLRQLRTRIEHLEHLEAKSPEPVNNEERAARARWEELRLRQWKQENRPNEVEKQLTEEEEAELDELTYRFHPCGSFLKSLDEALAELERSRQLEPPKKAAAPK